MTGGIESAQRSAAKARASAGTAGLAGDLALTEHRLDDARRRRRRARSGGASNRVRSSQPTVRFQLANVRLTISSSALSDGVKSYECGPAAALPACMRGRRRDHTQESNLERLLAPRHISAIALLGSPIRSVTLPVTDRRAHLDRET